MTEQLGSGNPTENITIAQDVIMAGSVAVNGVTVAPARASIATVPLTATTADIAAIGVAVNATLTALSDLGYVTKT